VAVMQLFGCQKPQNIKEEREEEGNTPNGVYSVIKFNRKKKIQCWRLANGLLVH